MIKNQWYAVLDSKELKKNKPIGITRVSQKLVFGEMIKTRLVVFLTNVVIGVHH